LNDIYDMNAVTEFWSCMDQAFGLPAKECVMRNLAMLNAHPGIQTVYSNLDKYRRAVERGLIADIFCVELLCISQCVEVTVVVDQFWCHPVYVREEGANTIVLTPPDPARSSITLYVRHCVLWRTENMEVEGEIASLCSANFEVPSTENILSGRTVNVKLTVDEDAFRLFANGDVLARSNHTIILEPFAALAARCKRSKLRVLSDGRWVRVTDSNTPHRRLGKLSAPDGNTIYIDEFITTREHNMWDTMRQAYAEIKADLAIQYPLFDLESHSVCNQVPVPPELGAKLFLAYFRHTNNKV